MCRRCIGYGTVTMRSGSISISIPTMTKDLAATFRNASNEQAAMRPSVVVDVRFHNFSASLEFEAWLNLYKIFDFFFLGGSQEIRGIDIVEVLQLGLFIDLTIVFRYMAYSPIEFFFGFNFTVEDGAGATLDLVNRDHPTIDLFDRTKFHHYPFRVSYDAILSINQTVSFRPAIRFGLEVAKVKIDEVELFVDVLRWTLSVALCKNLDDRCAPTNSTAKGQPLHILVKSIIQTDVVFGVLIKVGLIDVNPNAFLTIVPITDTQ